MTTSFRMKTHMVF